MKLWIKGTYVDATNILSNTGMNSFFQAAPLPTDLSAEEEPLVAVAPASADDVDSEPGLDLSGVAAAIGQV